MHPWDNLEQDFLAFVTAAEQMTRAICSQAEKIEDPKLCDNIMNLCIGLECFLNLESDRIADAMEDKISYDYENRP